jgi:hypothetical protein
MNSLVSHDLDDVELRLLETSPFSFHVTGYQCPRTADRQEISRPDMIDCAESDLVGNLQEIPP